MRALAVYSACVRVRVRGYEFRKRKIAFKEKRVDAVFTFSFYSPQFLFILPAFYHTSHMYLFLLFLLLALVAAYICRSSQVHTKKGAKLLSVYYQFLRYFLFILFLLVIFVCKQAFFS